MQDAGIKWCLVLLKIRFWHDVKKGTHTKTEYNSCTKNEEVRTLLVSWRQNFQNDVCKDTVENPDDFSLAELFPKGIRIWVIPWPS